MPRPAVEKAAQHVRQTMARLGTSQVQLPPARELAQGAGVSWVTMLRALKQLGDDGAIEVIHGRRCTVPCSSTRDAPPSETTRTKWQRTADRLHTDLLGGNVDWIGGSVKEIAAQYGVCTRTLSKALAELQLDGVIVRQDRKWCIPEMRRRRSAATIVLILGVEHAASRLDESIFSGDFFRQFELAVSKARLSLRIGLHWDPTASKIVDLRSGQEIRRMNDEAVLGYVYYLGGAQPVPRSLIGNMQRARKPVAVFDATTEPTRTELNYPPSRVKCFSVGTTARAGFLAGRYLAGLGYKSAVYLSPFHDQLWSKERYEGLCDFFTRASCLKPLCLSPAPQLTLRDYLEAGRTRHPPSRAIDAVQRYCAPMSKPFGRRFELAFADFWDTQLIDGEIAQRCEPLFDKTLDATAPCAVVCANDFTASLYMEFLRRKRIAVPERISVLSFDDSPVALRYSLTSYNFNIASVVGAMLRFLSGQPLPQTMKYGSRVEIDGVFVGRGSVRVAGAESI